MDIRKTLMIIFTTTSALYASLQIGDDAPDFTLNDEKGKSHTLSEYRGKNIVLYFYPKDNTPGCTKEACSFRDDYDKIRDLNTIIFGVSYDSEETHQKFKDKYSLPFILLSDNTKNVSKIYDAKGWFFMPKRKTYVIDEAGKIIKIYDKVDISSHSKDILELLSQ